MNNVYIYYITIPDKNMLEFYNIFPQKTINGKEEERKYAIRNEPLFNKIYTISCCNEQNKIYTFKLDSYESEKEMLNDFWVKLLRCQEEKNLIFYNKNLINSFTKKSNFYKIKYDEKLIRFQDIKIHGNSYSFVQPIELYSWCLFNDTNFHINNEEIDQLYDTEKFSEIYEISEKACTYVKDIYNYFI